MRDCRISHPGLAAFSWITISLVCTPCHAGDDSGFVPGGYQLTWSDEFDGNTPDTSQWHLRDTRRRDVSICLPRNVSLVDGHARIALKVEQHQGYPLTCGGLITKKKYRYGYFETAARLDPGTGWHEAFWTASVHKFDNNPPELRTTPRIEIDIFEHYKGHDRNTFCYGIIEWFPIRGGLCRTTPVVPENLSDRFNVWAFEFTPDYLNFFFNGRLLETADVSSVTHNDFHIWLSAIGTDAKGTKDGECFFDYLRCYEIDLESAAYAKRSKPFIAKLESLRNPDRGPIASKGRDLWIECEDFRDPGGWEISRDRYDKILAGRQGGAKLPAEHPALTARTRIEVPAAGRYRLWVRSKDYATTGTGTRRFRVAVNGRRSEVDFGTHGKDGFAWQGGGYFELPKGPTWIELIDSSQYFARTDRLLLTTDSSFVPSGIGGPANAQHLPAR